MKRDDVLEIANRLKSEGRAISPVTVCLEAYGQSLPDIAATLQQWREERTVPLDSALATLPTPEDFSNVMRDAIERCWAVAQNGVRGQVDAEIRGLKERAEQAERETGMLYIDLTRTLNELEACKRKLSEHRHLAAGTTRMIDTVETETVPVITDAAAVTAIEAPAEPESALSAIDEPSPIVEEPAREAQIDSAAIDEHVASDTPPVALPSDETQAVTAETALEETAQAEALEPEPEMEPEPELAVEPAEDSHEFASPILVPEAESVDGLAEQLALAEARVVAAEARVQELEAQLANAAESATAPAVDPAAAHDAQQAAQRIAEMETAFAQERQALQTKLDEAILQSAQWKQRAEQMRADFAPLKEHAAWVSAQSVGRSTLCSRLIVELARVSPGNPLLRKEVQQQIVDQAAQVHTG